MPIIQPKVTPLSPGLSLKGKTAIVTGATAGLGLETARQLLTLQADTVILACRNVKKGESTRELLLADANVKKHNPNGTIKVMEVDMDDYASVSKFTDKVKIEVPVVDILILNAGLGYLAKFEASKTGHERTVQINYLSNVLLILELLPHLKDSSKKTGTPSRITWVGSRSHYETTLQKKPIKDDESILGTFDNSKKYDRLKRYPDSKLLCASFFYDLASRVPKEEVLINMMCPGMIATDLSDNLPFHLRMVTNLLKAVRARPVEQGGWMLIHSAAVIGPESHGQFVLDKDIQP
jgi:NAD(P)-dependent dehydrogenase (short-subunit alcohol dehydrogenase family)